MMQISEKERWWAALSYIFSPCVPAVLFFIFDLDEMPFLKSHIYQALAAGIIFALLLPLLLAATLGIGGLFWLIMPYWALKAYHGENIIIPWISTFVKEQGWV
jgi:hypothetical protein